RLFEKLPAFEYDPGRRFRDWLHRLVQNAVADHWRRRQRRPGDHGRGGTEVRRALESLPAPREDAIAEVVRELDERVDEDRRALAACERVRGRVADPTWRAFWLTTVEGLKGREVAGRLGLAITAVHMAKSRVLRMIREELGVTRGGPGGWGQPQEAWGWIGALRETDSARSLTRSRTIPAAGPWGGTGGGARPAGRGWTDCTTIRPRKSGAPSIPCRPAHRRRGRSHPRRSPQGRRRPGTSRAPRRSAATSSWTGSPRGVWAASTAAAIGTSAARWPSRSCGTSTVTIARCANASRRRPRSAASCSTRA